MITKNIVVDSFPEWVTYHTAENHDKIAVIVHDGIIKQFRVKKYRNGSERILWGRKYHEKRPRRVTYTGRM